MKKILVYLTVSGAVLAACQGQVEHKREWSPTREVVATAPPPAHLEERIRAFDERNAPEAVAGLARQLFGLIDPDYKPESDAQAALYRAAWENFRAGKFLQALEAYKQFSFDRFRHPAAGVKIDPLDPAKRIFIEYYNTAEELMRGVFRFQVFDKPIPAEIWSTGTDPVINYFRAGKHNAHMVDVVLQNGMPGRMNWTYRVPGFFSGTWHIQDEEGYYAVAYRQSTCFKPLLVAYLEKGDVAYFNQWIGYMEDQMLNYRRDLAAAGIKMPTTSAGVSGVDLRHLFYLVLNAPNIDRDFPATTFARIQVQYWIEDLPLIVMGARATGANRAMHMYGALLTDARMRFPELRSADRFLEERRKILESYARQYMMPDGSSIDYAPNYNKNYINCTSGDIAFLRAMKNPPAWFSEKWVEELVREQGIMARYLIHSIAPDGSLPGYKSPLKSQLLETAGEKGFLSKFLPQALVDPHNKAVVENLLGKELAADPGYVSEAFPYAGYYVMRENWSPKARYLYFHDYRPGENGSWRHHKNLYVQAFGQRMLTAFRWESPLLVDGAGNMHSPLHDLYPESYDGRRGLFGSHGERSAWQEPQPNRWHTSDRFDLAEGNLKIPFAEKFDDKPAVFIDDVSHGRQVVYLRDAGAWIVTDRITAEKAHDFQLMWGFDADQINPPGWEKDWRNKNKAAEGANKKAYSKEQITADPKAGAIRTENPDRPNLSIFHAASIPLRLTPGDIVQNNDSMFGNSYRTGPAFQTDKSAVVASLLYPRDTKAPDVASFQPVKISNGAGFDAVTPDGVKLEYRAGLTPQDLAAGAVHARASTLLLSESKEGKISGIALDCTSMTVAEAPVSLPTADFEFAMAKDGTVSFTPIYRPMAPVTILPERDVFLGSADVTFEHPAGDVEIRYTLDGSDPTLSSPLFAKPVRIDETTTVRAIAVRKGVEYLAPTTDSTLASIPASATFTKASGYWPAVEAKGLKPGLAFQYFEDDWTLSLLKLPILTPVGSGVSPTWMDVSAAKKSSTPYAFVYDGYLKVPQDGVYTIHAPWEFCDVGERAGYDIEISVDGHAWDPARRAHNYGNWSIPLAAGAHTLQVRYVDIRRGAEQARYESNFQGEKPEILISGPNLPTQPVPSDWIFHR